MQIGVGVSAFSCGGTVSICVSADESVVKDPEMLRRCILEEYKSLCEAWRSLEPKKTYVAHATKP